MHFCYKLQKYIIRFVYLQQRIYAARRVTMQKNPPQIRSAGDCFYYIIYPALLLRMRYEINQRYNSRCDRCADNDVVYHHYGADACGNSEHACKGDRNPHGG